MNRIFQIPAINLDFRSPYSFDTTPGLPPAGRAQGGAPITYNPDTGAPIIAGMELTPYHSNTPGSDHPVSAIYDQAAFGDVFSMSLTWTSVGFPVDANGNLMPYVLQRAPNQRTQLLIQNNTLGNLYYAFDREADNTTCIAIAPGGSREWDTRVPQGALSLYAIAAAANGATIEFMNNNVI